MVGLGDAAQGPDEQQAFASTASACQARSSSDSRAFKRAAMASAMTLLRSKSLMTDDFKAPAMATCSTIRIGTRREILTSNPLTPRA